MVVGGGGDAGAGRWLTPASSAYREPASRVERWRGALPRPRMPCRMSTNEDQPPACPALPWRDRHLLLIASVALTLRGILAVVVGKPEWPDSGGYLAIAANLLAGRGYSIAAEAPFEPTMFREPLYPLFLAAASMLPGSTVVAAQILQIVLAALTCLLAVQLAVGVGASRHVALGAGWLAALHPTFAVYSGYILSEVLSAFVLTLGLLALVHGWRRGRNAFFVAAGVMLGASVLCKAALILLPLCLACVFAILKTRLAARYFSPRSNAGVLSMLPSRDASWIGALLMLSTVALVVAPWSVRNNAVFGSFNVAVRGGESLWARAQTLEVSEEEASKRMIKYRRQLRAKGLNEPQTDAVMGAEARSILGRIPPGKYLLGNFQQVWQFWVCSGNSGSSESEECPSLKCRGVALVRSVVPAGFGAMALLMIVGMAAMLRRPGAVLVAALPVVYLTIIHSLFSNASCRYSVTVLPAAMVFLAQGIALSLSVISRLWSRS